MTFHFPSVTAAERTRLDPRLVPALRLVAVAAALVLAGYLLSLRSGIPAAPAHHGELQGPTVTARS